MTDEIDQSSSELICSGVEYKKIKKEWVVLPTGEHEPVHMTYEGLIHIDGTPYYVYECPKCHRKIPL